MEIGIVGLGRMGSNIVKRLIKKDHKVIAYDIDTETLKSASSNGAIPVHSLSDLVMKLVPPRIIWIMLPSGIPTEDVITSLKNLLINGDTIIDGGNSNYIDSIRRNNDLNKLGLIFMDVGTSGGIWGAKQGFSLMIGGDYQAFQTIEPIFKALAPKENKGYGYVGPSGAGHFTKMIHNGIEYGLMQAYAEGFEIMKAKKEFDLDLYQIAEIWRYGSVVRSWLLELTAHLLKDNQELTNVRGYVDDSGEGKLAVMEALELGIPAPVMALSLQRRYQSRQSTSFGAKILESMRNQFGGHPIQAPKDLKK